MAEPLSTAKQRVLEHLKLADGATASEIAVALGITEAAVRQHIDALVEMGLVVRRAQPRSRTGRGRSPLEWEVTPQAGALFADRHGQLTVELLGAITDALGTDGLERVIDARAEHQLAAYRAAVPAAGEASLEDRVRALAQQRSDEGYMADVQCDGGDGVPGLLPLRARAVPRHARARRHRRAHRASARGRCALRVPRPPRRRERSRLSERRGRACEPHQN
jgi:predicted ArsR family transcriptional regulator